MLNSEPAAFGALRIIVNPNQLGEAAGIAAYVCSNENADTRKINGKKIARLLRDGGSAIQQNKKD